MHLGNLKEKKYVYALAIYPNLPLNSLHSAPIVLRNQLQDSGTAVLHHMRVDLDIHIMVSTVVRLLVGSYLCMQHCLEVQQNLVAEYELSHPI